MSAALTELYRFVEMGFVDPFARNNNLYFVLDRSGSMAELVVGTRTRMDIAKQQLIDVLDRLLEISAENGISIDVGVCSFSGAASTTEIVRRGIDATKVEELKAWVAALTPIWGGTAYNYPMQFARNHFLVPSPGWRRACFFITDGVPEPASSADAAASLAADMIARTGLFSKAVDNDVSIYGIAVDLFDTVQLAKLDNTPRDGIQSISSTSSQGLYNALLTPDYEEKLVWTYTNAPYEVTYAGEVYAPAAVQHSEVESKEDIARANLDITFDVYNDAARRWMKDSIEAIVTATVWQLHEDDDVSVIWKGRLTGVRPSGVDIKLSFDSIFTSLARPGLGARYQRMCRHALYGRGCKVAKSAHGVQGVPSAVAGAVVTVPEAAGYPDGWFSGGMIETPDGALRFVIGHAGAQLTLMRPMESLIRLFTQQGYGTSYGMIYGGLVVKLYPGCDRSRGTCNSKFNNLENYGGFDWIPTRNPFAGSSIV